jgi:hypothetical protein
MKPIKFEYSNVVYAENQYQPLPAFRDADGSLLTCWEVSPEELEEIKKTGRIYIQVLTFNNPLQPLLPGVKMEDFLNLNLGDNEKHT